MTPIPDDHADYRETSPEESARRLAAAISGALEGFVEALDKYDLANEAKRGIGEAGSLVRATAEEGRAQAATPEMQQLGGYARSAGAATAGAVHTASDSVRSATHAVRERTRETSGKVRETAQHVAETAQHAAETAQHAAEEVREQVRERVETAKEAAQQVKEEVKVRAEAVAESGRRAKVAPRRISQELRAALSAWTKGLAAWLALMLGMAVFAIITLVVLTIALVVGLNELLGDPAGTFLVALLYLVVAGVAWLVARAARNRARQESSQRVENAKEEARSVVRPVREAFGRGRMGA